MLDIMRKKKRMKAIVLWVVIIAVGGSMVVWGVALNLGGSGRSALGSYAAIVDEETISMKEFLENYQRSLQRLNENAQTELDAELLKSLGISQQILNSLITSKIVEILADRVGVTVTDNEVGQAIIKHPELQVDGKFIGLERYQQILAANRIPLERFERDIRYTELANKLSRTITDSLDVSDRELREEFSRLNQTTTVDYVLLNKDTFKKRVKPTDEELQAYFEENKETYRIKEKRRARYLLVPTSEILPAIKVTEEEIKDEWDRNPVPETVEVAHILFLVKDPAEEEEVRTRAEAVLKKAQGGEDFAALANQYSEDTSSADQGGYLGPLQRGQMPMKEFEEAAFSLNPGEISGLVRTRDYGFHIIKVFRHDRPTLESNRLNLMTTIQFRKAKEKAKNEAEKAAELSADLEDLEAIGKELDVETEVKETDLFKNDDNPYSLGISQALLNDIFQIKEIGSIGNVVEHTLGYAFAKLEEVQMARPGQFEESREQVRKDFIEAEAKERMQEAAKTLSDESAQMESLAKAAGKQGYELKTSPNFKISESPGPDIANMNAFNAAAFELEPGNISKPIEMTDTTAVLQVKARSPFDEAAFEKERDELYNQMLSSMQAAYLEDYLRSFREKLEEDGKILINPEIFEMAERISF
ncbi:MAG: SurA N-terminal domain-containing protein [Acidobacteria bacterium]|nr:SurA N-terminal domain-containing protein [Acidobacteriota bacterium]